MPDEILRLSRLCVNRKGKGAAARRSSGPSPCHRPGAGLSPPAVAPGSGPADSASDDPLIQPRPVPALSFVQRIRADGRSRAIGVGLTLLIQLLLLFVLLSLGTVRLPGAEERTNVVSLRVEEIAEEATETPRPEPEQQAEERPETQRSEPEEVQPPQSPAPEAPPLPPPILPPLPQVPPSPAPPRASPPAQQPVRPIYGPPDTRSPAMRDTERVGTMPNGEPLYAAAWYREPEDAMLSAYLSTARGPGWGLIACRTAPDFRVEECVALDEYPQGSQIARSVLAAAWEFRVRPPRRGGQVLVGSWVRIRIDYGIRRR
jgi:protein TonB